MPQKLKFKHYRRVASFISDVRFLKKLTGKQESILGRLRSKGGRLKSQKLSHLGQKIQSKRLFSVLYGNISQKQYSLLFQKALKYPGKIGMNFLSLAEKRLDVVVFRMFFFKTLKSSRQYISHGGILVNNTLMNVSEYEVKIGDIIQIKDPIQFLSQSNSYLPHKIGVQGISKNETIDPLLESRNSNEMNAKKQMGKKKSSKASSYFKFPHLEVNHKIFTGIFLFSPQQVYYPLTVQISDLIKMS